MVIFVASKQNINSNVFPLTHRYLQIQSCTCIVCISPLLYYKEVLLQVQITGEQFLAVISVLKQEELLSVTFVCQLINCYNHTDGSFAKHMISV